MMLTGLAGLRKVLQFSRVIDHTGFDAALHGLRELTRISNVPALEAPRYIDGKQNGEFDSQPKNQSVAKDADIFSITDLAKEIETQKPKAWEYKLTEELLRTNVSPIVDQWHQLAGGTCTKKYGVVAHRANSQRGRDRKPNGIFGGVHDYFLTAFVPQFAERQPI